MLRKLTSIDNSVAGINGSITGIENKLQSLSAALNGVAEECQLNSANLRKTDLRMDALEQYTRRNNLRLVGIPEDPNEKIDEIVIHTLNEKLKLNLTLHDVERSHRVGKRAERATRAIIIKFASYRTRANVFKEKRHLKGTGLTLREDLTKFRLDLFRKAVDGEIICKMEGSRTCAT